MHLNVTRNNVGFTLAGPPCTIVQEISTFFFVIMLETANSGVLSFVK